MRIPPGETIKGKVGTVGYMGELTYSIYFSFKSSHFFCLLNVKVRQQGSRRRFCQPGKLISVEGFFGIFPFVFFFLLIILLYLTFQFITL